LHKVVLGLNRVRVSGLVRTSNEEIPSHWGAPTRKMRTGSISKELASTPKKEEEEIRIGIKMPASIEDKDNLSGTQENLVCVVGNLRATPYNNQFNLNGHGRHAFRLRESRAGTQRRPSFPGRPPLAMDRQVNWALYGRNKRK
jgi:hypothetical protein